MKSEGQKLQTVLRRQVESVRLVDDDGVLGNSPLIIRKHYAKWKVQRQAGLRA